MSEIKVTTLETNTLSAPSINVAGATTINSTGLYLSNTSGVINSTAIFVSNSSGNNSVKTVMNVSSIVIGGTGYDNFITETVNTQIFTANGTWIKPSWATDGRELVMVHMWGGGGGGATRSTGASGSSWGGGGGAFVFGYYKINQLANSANVIVGSGGAGGFQANGGVGGTSSIANSIGGLFRAFGGGGGFANSSADDTGAGGGWFGPGIITTSGGTGGAPLGGTSGPSTFGGGGTRRGSIYGGGGGGTLSNDPINSIFGGAGGTSGSGKNISIYGGSGGNTTTSAEAPGGGGSGNLNNTGGAPGARGEVRVYTYRYTPPSLTVFSQAIDDITSNNIAVPMTNVRENDLIVVFTFDGDGRTHTGNSSFTTASTGSIGNAGAGLFWKIASASEPSEYIFRTSGTATALGAIVTVWRNVQFGAAGVVGTSTVNNIVLPGITLPSNGNKKILIAAIGGRALGTYTTPAGYSTLFQDNDATKATYYMAYKLTYDTGATGDLTVTNNNGSAQVGILYYLTY